MTPKTPRSHLRLVPWVLASVLALLLLACLAAAPSPSASVAASLAEQFGSQGVSAKDVEGSYTLTYDMSRYIGAVTFSDGETSRTQQKEAGEDVVLPSSADLVLSDAPVYLVEFTLDCNGGSLEGAETVGMTATSQEEQTLNGWMDTSDNTLYELGATYTKDASTTFELSMSVTTGAFNETLPEPERACCEFAGWYDSAEGGNFIAGAGDNIPSSAPSVLYAHWTVTGYTLTYDADGADAQFVSDSSKVKTQYKAAGEAVSIIDDDVSLVLAPPIAGYTYTLDPCGGVLEVCELTSTFTESATFEGWKDPYDGHVYKPGDSFEHDADTVFEAYFTYEPTNDQAIFPKPERPGSDFDGWYDAAEGGTLVGRAGEAIPEDAPLLLYAHWAGTDSEYTITYDATIGGGLFADGSATKTQGKPEGETVYIIEEQPVREQESTQYTWQLDACGGVLEQATLSATESCSYDFAGWFNDADGNLYMPGDPFDEDGEAFLEATFDANPSFEPALLPEPTFEGHDFDGWFDAQEGGNLIGKAGDALAKDAPSELYAHWTAFYTITYEMGDEEGAAFADGDAVKTQKKVAGQNVSIIEDEVVAAQIPSSVAAEYALEACGGIVEGGIDSIAAENVFSTGFAGWLDEEGAVVYEPGETFSKDANTTLTAQFTKGSMTVYPVLPTAHRDDYDFDGWFDAQEGGELVGQAGDTLSADAPATLYAHWTYRLSPTPESYTLTYDAGLVAAFEDGTRIKTQLKEEGEDVSIIEDEVHSILGSAIAEGKHALDACGGTVEGGISFVSWSKETSAEFAGWKDDSDGTVYKPGDAFAKDADTAFSATFASKTSSQYDLLPSATRDGYELAGWFDAPRGGNLVGAAGDEVPERAPATLYAHWTSTTGFYTLVYDTGEVARFADGESVKTQQKEAGKDISIIGDEVHSALGPASTAIGFALDACGGTIEGGITSIESSTVTTSEFAGWKDSADNTVYQPADMFSQDVDATFTPVFNPKTETTAAVLPKASKTNFELVGWYDSESGGKLIGVPGDQVMLEAPATLYAHWTEKSGGDVPKFSDVGATTDHADEIAQMAEAGISKGWTESDGTVSFRPYHDVARADMAAFLFRLAVRWGVADENWKPDSTQAKSFADVTYGGANETPHAREILWLASAGISKGWDVGGTKEFRPYLPVARQDMAAFMHRLAQFAQKQAAAGWTPSASAKTMFSDVDAYSTTNHHEDIWWLADTKVSKGFYDGTFRGLENVKRCDMAAFIMRLDALS